MRPILALALILASAAPFVVVEPQALAADTKPYADKTLGYALEVPASWAIAPGMIMAATSPKDGPKDAFQETIKVVAADLHEGLTLARYVEGSLAAWKAIWTVRESKQIEVGGEPAFRLVIDQKLGAQTTRLLKTFVAHGGKIYVITCAAEPRRFQAYLEAFSDTLASFSFTEIKAATGPQTLQVPGGRLSFPATWQRVMAEAISRKAGDHRATVMVSTRPGTVAFALAAARDLYKDGDLGRVTTDAPAPVAGRTGHKLVVEDGTPEDGDTEILLFAEHAGKVVELRFKVDAIGQVPAELTADFEAMAASWKWE